MGWSQKKFNITWSRNGSREETVLSFSLYSPSGYILWYFSLFKCFMNVAFIWFHLHKMLGEKYEKQDFFFTMCTSLGIILPNKISFQGHLLKFQLFVYSKSQNPMKMLILPTSINVFGFQLIIPLSLKTPDTDKHLIITILKQL